MDGPLVAVNRDLVSDLGHAMPDVESSRPQTIALFPCGNYPGISTESLSTFQYVGGCLHNLEKSAPFLFQRRNNYFYKLTFTHKIFSTL